mmetsp:Transcript_20592/g.32205  ORF Transcript_20592/g.32205 Transcript_20592/m.32205 type:complete len:97 (-) Transcript_20592:739-1029(-)
MVNFTIELETNNKVQHDLNGSSKKVVGSVGDSCRHLKSFQAFSPKVSHLYGRRIESQPNALKDLNQVSQTTDIRLVTKLLLTVQGNHMGKVDHSDI